MKNVFKNILRVHSHHLLVFAGVGEAPLLSLAWWATVVLACAGGAQAWVDLSVYFCGGDRPAERYVICMNEVTELLRERTLDTGQASYDWSRNQYGYLYI